MEIEKKRETVWKLKQREKHEFIELTSVEESGEVNLIKLSLKKTEDSITVEMNKSEFNNFLSILSAFKDVVIGSEINMLTPELKEFEEEESQNEKVSTSISEEDKSTEEVQVPNISEPQNEISNEKLYEEELNPKEWDPW